MGLQPSGTGHAWPRRAFGDVAGATTAPETLHALHALPVPREESR